jgi:FMN phosphatase YigB (HAD superfamily)
VNSSRIKLILLDCYGIVMSRGYPDTVAALHARFGMDEKRAFRVMYTKYFNMAAVRRVTQKEAWERSVRDLRVPMTTKELERLHLGLMRTNKNVLAVVRKLRKHYPVILLTKNTRSQLAWVSRRFPELRHTFGKDILNTWEYKLPKASTATIRFIAKRFGIRPEEMLYLEDQRSNLREPRALGVRGVFCKTPQDAVRVLRSLSPECFECTKHITARST